MPRSSGRWPNAARMLELRQRLGYRNGKPPKDVERRFKTLVDQDADPLTKELLKGAQVPGLATGDLQTRLALYLYFTQPGGSAEAFILRLKKEGKAPGFAEGEKGSLTGFLTPRDLNSTFPACRSFTAAKKADRHATTTRWCGTRRRTPGGCNAPGALTPMTPWPRNTRSDNLGRCKHPLAAVRPGTW